MLGDWYGFQKDPGPQGPQPEQKRYDVNGTAYITGTELCERHKILWYTEITKTELRQLIQAGVAEKLGYKI